MTKFKTVELLTKCAKGKKKTYSCTLADKLIKRGLAKEVEAEPVEPKKKSKPVKK